MRKTVVFQLHYFASQVSNRGVQGYVTEYGADWMSRVERISVHQVHAQKQFFYQNNILIE